MALFMIRREIPGATQEEIDAAAYRAIACSFYYSGLRWISSYWDRDGAVLHCIYEALNADQVFEHARVSRIPCDEVREVSQLGPENYTAESSPDVAVEV